MTTKKQLLQVLQMVYNNIPECSCTIDYTARGLQDPGCIRHCMFTKEEIKYIRIVLSNESIINNAEEFIYKDDPTYP